MKHILLMLALLVAPMIAEAQSVLISQPACTVKDGTGTCDAGGTDYASSPDSFYVGPPAGQIWEIQRVLVGITDNNNTITSVNEYGGLGDSLNTGIVVSVQRGATTLYTLTAFPILTNSDWSEHCYDVRLDDYGAGDDHIAIRWTFARHGQPVILRGDLNEFITVSLRDNLSGLLGHRFTFEGYVTNQSY